MTLYYIQKFCTIYLIYTSWFIVFLFSSLVLYFCIYVLYIIYLCLLILSPVLLLTFFHLFFKCLMQNCLRVSIGFFLTYDNIVYILFYSTDCCFKTKKMIQCYILHLSLDIDECRYGYCQQLCANHPGSYSCSCGPGYLINSDSRTCQGDQIYKCLLTSI